MDSKVICVLFLLFSFFQRVFRRFSQTHTRNCALCFGVYIKIGSQGENHFTRQTKPLLPISVSALQTLHETRDCSRTPTAGTC